jgi:hypothetical protein
MDGGEVVIPPWEWRMLPSHRSDATWRTVQAGFPTFVRAMYLEQLLDPLVFCSADPTGRTSR